MWSEEAMELRDVSLLNLILAGRRTSAPASAKHEDHHTEWATQGPLVFAMFRFKVSRSNRRRNQCMFARLRVLHVKTVYVFTRVCVCGCDVLECALSVKLSFATPASCLLGLGEDIPSHFGVWIFVWKCKHFSSETRIMKPFQAVSLLSGLAPSSSGDSPRSAVNICRPCCGEAFELPVKAVALGINEEDTINTLILYSNIVSLYI